MFIPGPASRHRRPREMHDLLQREAEPQGPGLLQGRHARLPERGEEYRRYPESVSATTRETLICTGL